MDGYGLKPDTPTPADGDVIISPSRIDSMRLNPCRVRHRNDPGYLGVWGQSAVEGIAAHAAIQRILQGDSQVEAKRSSLLLATYREVLTKNGHRLEDLADKATINESVKRCKRLVSAWYSWWQRQELDVVETEVEHTMPIGKLPDGRGVWLTGIIDAIVQTPNGQEIYDWKTTAKPWGSGEGQSRAQTPLYPALARDAGFEVEAMTYVTIDSKGEVEEHPVDINPTIVAAGVADAWEWACMIAFDIYPCTPFAPAGVYNRSTKRYDIPRGWHSSPQYAPEINVCKHKLLHPDAANDTHFTPKWKVK